MQKKCLGKYLQYAASKKKLLIGFHRVQPFNIEITLNFLIFLNLLCLYFKADVN